MKKITLMLLLIGIGSVYAQRNQLPRNLIKLQTTERPDYGEIEGSPFFEDEFSTSYIFLKNDGTMELDLRLNLFTCTFETMEKGELREVKKSEQIKKITYMGDIYKLVKFRTPEGNSQKDYLTELVKGDCSLYKRVYVEFKEEEKPKKAYDEYKPPRFERASDEYYLKFSDDKEAKYISTFRKRKFLDVFFNKSQKKLLRWIKDNNINLRKEDELIRFIEHVNNKG